MDNKIWLSSPHLSGSELNFVKQAFDTNWVAPIGPNINGFEKDLESYLKENTHIAALSSGTAAIHLALVQAGVGPDDEVICQSFSFCATVNPIIYLGARPILVDSEKDTWNICPKALKEAVEDRISKGKKPKAILAVHLYGMPYKIDEVHAFAKAHKIPVIEDSAEALGSTYKSRKCGTFGDYGVLSFNGNKVITTSGGGALVCHSKETKDKTVFLATQARDQAPHYQHSEVGYNYRLSNISAGIGRGQMEVLDKYIVLRQRMNKFYQEIFKDIEGVRVQKEYSKDIASNHWLTVILVDSSKTGGITREDLRLALKADNIESRPLWKPMHLQPLCEDFPYYGNKVCETLFENGLCLPSGSNLNDNDRSRIKSSILKVFKK
ncbi:dTDP-4-amino-4,6-dideoxygalactose transaminase [Nonlabens dokdonensis]|jgi:dTDP-4-amino-4,6-dideoxygalactose transaminase|uniref:dTDP-4-amino-4,6-dideoxygalactose transaminase n=2 Tax=Nonlabens dokdonensis TaxID=328515 RepID=A0ABX5PWD5_9FLAO|nr:DegT/DnrJ/EryC1/StrS family aminotransferase [Nonlabens dokdonensis]AGC78660.1 putative aminotransferase [Nonlabens dokdonensis DSW-6]PZX39213.1 dTDP-4-amino-4,6-dideoxygalactose transaminase [Nonlabens dokdonensis]